MAEGYSTGPDKEDHAINDDSLSISRLIAKLQRPGDIFTRLRSPRRFPFPRFRQFSPASESATLLVPTQTINGVPVKPWDPIKRGLTTPGTALKFKITRI